MKNSNIEDLYRLSPVQEGMLFHTLQESGPEASGVAPYFEQFVITYPRGLDTARAEVCWRKLVERHAVLRTSFFWEEVEEPVQLVHRRAEVRLEEMDLRDLPLEERERRLDDFLLEERRRGFALDRAPLMRITAVRWEGEVCRLVWSYHHLLLDGWSVGLLLQEVTALYDAEPSGPAPVLPPVRPFRDYIAWLRQQDLQTAESYWRRELGGLPEPPSLGFDRQPGQPVAPGDTHARVVAVLPEADMAALTAFARRNRLTFHTVAEGAWALALSRCSGGARDVVFGNTVAGRPASLPGAATMIGCFINTLPVRVRIEPDRSLLTWLQELQAGQLELRRYEHSPLVEVRRWAGVPAGRSLFDALLVFENAALLPEEAAVWAGFQRTNYPLTVQVWPGRDLRMEAGFYRGRFEPEAVSRFLELVGTFLRSFLEAAPDARLIDLPALSPEEARQIAAWNQTRVEYPLDHCLHDAVTAQVRRTPEAVAASYEGIHLTYRELEERANRLAHHLRRLGVGLEDRVGVALERGLDLSVALLAVLKAGGAYVPLEPSYPAERLAMLAEDAFRGLEGPVILTHSRLAERLPDGARIVALDAIGDALAAESPEPLSVLATPDSLAYVLFTSGSTGRPKGAGNTHRGVLNRLLWMQEAYGLGPDDRVLQKTPFSFDVSGWEFFWPLLTGARLVYAAPGGHQDPSYLVRLMAEEGITTFHFVPSMLAVFLDEPGLDRLTALRRVVASGEALTPALVRRAFSRLPTGVELHNLYGPTEAAIDVTAWPCSAADESIPIGRPVPNTRIHVLDPDLRPVPVGIPGELGIAGVQVGRGYLGKPDLTAERFMPEEGGNRLYRTGDLARWRPDGALEYLGRLDHQVKVRGVRIELGEVEAVLASLPGVREAVVMAREDEPGDVRLVAYVVADDVTPLRERLRAVLPEAMIPSVVVALPALPLSPNGKVDRKGLPAPEIGVTDAAGYVPPRDATEEAIAEVWTALLKAPRVGATDNFFALGGDSIKAVRLVSRVNSKLSTGLRVQDVFQHPTVEALAGRIASARAERSLAEEREAGLAEIERRREAVLSDERWRGRVPADAEDFFPLSGIEKGMVYYSLLLPDQPIYHDQYAYLLSIDDVEVFFRALELLVGRHEILRTTFHLYDFPEPMKVVRRRIPLSWEVEDLRGLAAEEQHRRVSRHRAEDLRRKFTFDGELLWRLRLFWLEERLFCAVWTWHHATLDGWSNVVFWQELNDLCGRPDLGALEALPPLSSSYKDYVAITLGRGRSERTEAFWKETLAGAERNKLPFHRGTVRGTSEVFGMRTTERLFGRDLLGALRGRARQLGTSLQALCLAGHVHLLRVTTGESDVVTGVVSHDRPGIPDGDRIIGCFLNTVPVRLRAVPGESGAALARRVTEYLAAEKAHEIPLPDIAALVGAQEAGGNPFFDTLLNFTDFHAMEEVEENRLFRPDALSAPRTGLDLASSEMTNTLFDAEVSATLGRFGVRIKYSPRHFEPADVARAADLYARILEALARDPEAPLGVEALLSEAERDQLVHRYNDTARDYPRERPLHRFFEEQAALRPEAEAVVCGGRSLSYGELERQANRLAHALIARGVRPGENVGICWERSVELMAGLLAILKAGGAYVPLEPSYPPARKGYVVRQSQVSRVLADREYELPEDCGAEILVLDPAACPDSPPAVAPPRPEDLAYTIYTSGSTGNPKGVMIEHHSAANLIAWVNREFSVGPKDRVLMLSSVCFDLSVYDLFGGLGAGAAVVVARREEIEDPAALKRLVVEQRVTFWDSVPSTLGLLVQYLEDTDTGFRGEHLRLAFLSGDWIPLSLPERARRFFPNLQVISLGGATEGTIWSIFRPIGELDPSWVSIPYGRPLDNNAFYVLDRHRELVPPGVAGDLYIGGLGVARGYSGEPIKTAASYGPDPFSGVPGARLYRTGDLGRMMAHGEIEFLGRSDHQVKVRGFRVELGEIESQLGRCPGIREAVVLARPDRTGQKYLCAYVVGPEIPANPEIQAHLARHLPDYMVPDVFVRLAELPLTANGKIDRAALPDPGADEAGLAEEYVAPAGEVETALAEIWEEVLGVRGVPGIRGIGARHDFFTLGGHSLSAIQVLTRVRTRFGVDLPLPAFFESPTIAGAARVIARLLERPPVQEDGERAIRHGIRPERLPLSFAQERFWFLYRLDPASAAFNIGGTARLDGRLSVPALAASVDEVLRRHEALRTRFGEENGERFQTVDPFTPAGLPVADLSGLPAAVRGPETERILQASTLRPFDLTRDRLMRPLLVRLGESSHVVHFTFHHIVGDGWSMGLLLREMAALYRAFLLGLPSPLPPLPVQYPDFALWQRRWLTGERLEQQLGYWRRRLAAPLPTLELPAQRPRPSTPRFHGAAETVAVPRDLAAVLADLGRTEGATPFMVFLAAFESLLHLYSGETDLLVGINVANRGRREIEDLIGFFVNNLVLRTDLSGDPSFREAVRRLRDTAVEAFAHQDVPYEAVLQEVQPQRWGDYAPLFQVMFVYQSFRGDGPGGGALPGVEMGAYTLPVRTANFDLTLTLNETAGDLLGLLIYDTDLFEPAFIARMAEHFSTLLEAVAADPDRPLSEIPIASENQARQLTSAFSEEL